MTLPASAGWKISSIAVGDGTHLTTDFEQEIAMKLSFHGADKA